MLLWFLVSDLRDQRESEGEMGRKREREGGIEKKEIN